MNLTAAITRNPPTPRLWQDAYRLAATVEPIFGHQYRVGRYLVHWNDGEGTCECAASDHDRYCKHLIAVAYHCAWDPRPTRYVARYTGDPFAGLT